MVKKLRFFLPLSILLAVSMLACSISVPSFRNKEVEGEPTRVEETLPVEEDEPTEVPAVELPAESEGDEDEDSTSNDLPSLNECETSTQGMAMREGEPLPPIDSMSCYSISLNIHPTGEIYSGLSRVHLLNQTGNTLEDLVFRLYPNLDGIYAGELAVLDVKVDGETVAFDYEGDDDSAIRIPLEVPLEPDEFVTVELSFEGSLPVDFQPVGGYGIFNMSTDPQEISLANWYPILAEYEYGDWDLRTISPVGDAVVSVSSFYDVSIRPPEGWEVAATGTMIEDTDDHVRFTSGPVRDFMLLASPDYELKTTSMDGITINHWSLKDITSDTSIALDVGKDSIRIFNDLFGMYPFAEVDIVDLPLQYAAGVEFPGIVLIEASLYEDGYFVYEVIAHEIAHQWWYSAIGNDVLEDPYQDEGLTTFSALLYLEDVSPDNFTQELDYYRFTVDSSPADGSAADVDQPVEAFEDRESEYSDVIYLRGALFFQDVREEIGDDAFFAALQDYYSNFKYGLVQPEVLLNLFEESCGCELDPLYEEYGIP